MKAYVVVQETVTDEAMFAAYRQGVPATLAPHGGRVLVGGGDLTVVEGAWPHPRLVIIEFPSRADAEAWYGSPAYRELLPLRLASATCNLVIADGPT